MDNRLLLYHQPDGNYNCLFFYPNVLCTTAVTESTPHSLPERVRWTLLEVCDRAGAYHTLHVTRVTGRVTQRKGRDKVWGSITWWDVCGDLSRDETCVGIYHGMRHKWQGVTCDSFHRQYMLWQARLRYHYRIQDPPLYLKFCSVHEVFGSNTRWVVR